MTRYHVVHETTYHYRAPVVTSHNEARLRPRALDRQAVVESRLEIVPAPDTVSWRKDYYGNEVVYFDLERPHDQLRLVATSTVDLHVVGPVEADVSPAWQEVVSAVRGCVTDQDLYASQFVLDSTLVLASPGLEAYARPSFPPGGAILSGVADLSGRIFRDFTYDETATHVGTPIVDVLQDRRGVCQDFAHVMIGCLRSLGIPARYVSGYVPPTSGTADGMADIGTLNMIGAHASHAWVAAFCGDLGWVEVDPTNDLMVGGEHIVLGWGRDYDDVSPVRGVTVGGGHGAVSVGVRVQAIG